MSELQNDKAFGSYMASRFKIGSLVSWSEWKIVDNMIDEDVFYGTVVDKTIKINTKPPNTVRAQFKNVPIGAKSVIDRPSK